MRKRRFAQVSTSEDEDDEAPKLLDKKGKRKIIHEEEEEEEEEQRGEEEEDPEEDPEEEEEDPDEDPQAIPIGDPIRITGKKRKKRHYSAFEYENNRFELEDPVLLTPETEDEKPYVAIIKDISDSGRGLMVTGQWFYRPEEAPKKGGGTWQARDTRELFYSFHLDDVPAESVMHKCIAHFVPLHKKLPLRSENPGFIVQKVYDTVQKKLWKLTDKDYEDGKQNEIDVLVKKTMDRLGELPDVDPEDAPPDPHHEQSMGKGKLRRKNFSEESSKKSDQLGKAEAPYAGDVSEYHIILAKYKVLTGDPYRDKWLEKLLQGIQSACNSRGNASAENKDNGNPAASDRNPSCDNGSTIVKESIDECSNGGEKICWPDSAVSAITALEKASYENFGSVNAKYNQKMRQLDFNFRGNEVLARRLLKKELEPLVILFMSPSELKDGVTAEERPTNEPEESRRMQMTDARCSRCMKQAVYVADIIHTGGHGDRYQLECTSCGHMWYSSRDAISSLTVDVPNVTGNVGTAPLATVKFEEVEKQLATPRETEKPQADVFEKSTAAYMPVLESQKSFSRSKTDDPSTPSAANRE